MFDVYGYCDDVAYHVVVDRAAKTRVLGSARVRDMLSSRVGDSVAVTPTGPFFTLNLDDESSVLAALVAWTTVTSASGDLPQIVPPEVAGAVY